MSGFSNTIKITPVRRTSAIWGLWKTHKCVFFPNCMHEKSCYYQLIIYMKKSHTVSKKGKSVHITELPFFGTVLSWNCTALSQSDSRIFFIYIILNKKCNYLVTLISPMKIILEISFHFVRLVSHVQIVQDHEKNNGMLTCWSPRCSIHICFKPSRILLYYPKLKN